LRLLFVFFFVKIFIFTAFYCTLILSCTSTGTFQFFYLIPGVIYVMFSIVVVAYVTRKLLRTGLPESLANRLNLVVRLIVYTILFVCLWVVPIINRTMNLVEMFSGKKIEPTKVKEVFEQLNFISEGCMAIVDVVIFGTHQAIIDFICCRRKAQTRKFAMIEETEEDELDETSTTNEPITTPTEEANGTEGNELANRRKSKYYMDRDVQNAYGVDLAVSDMTSGSKQSKEAQETLQTGLMANDYLSEGSGMRLRQRGNSKHDNESATGLEDVLGQQGSISVSASERQRRKTRLVTKEVAVDTPEVRSSLGINIDAVMRRDMMYCIMLGINECVKEADKDVTPLENLKEFSAVQKHNIKRYVSEKMDAFNL